MAEFFLHTTVLGESREPVLCRSSKYNDYKKQPIVTGLQCFKNRFIMVFCNNRE